MTHEKFIIPSELSRRYYQLANTLGCTRDYLIHTALKEVANRLESGPTWAEPLSIPKAPATTSPRDSIFSLPGRVHVRYQRIAEDLGCGPNDLIRFGLTDGINRVSRQIIKRSPSTDQQHQIPLL